MTGPTVPSEAVEAAVEAMMDVLEKRWTTCGISPFVGDDGGAADDAEADCRAMLAAAVPVLQAQERERTKQAALLAVCLANHHKPRRLVGNAIPCGRCSHAWQVHHCDHRAHGVAPRWAGVLGWRYDCLSCGTQMSGYDAEATDPWNDVARTGHARAAVPEGEQG